MPILPEKRPAGKPSANGASIKSEARRLGELGYAVTTCIGKRPNRRNWDKAGLKLSEVLALTDESELNLAILLNESGVVDLECDSEAAEASLQRLFSGNVPPTPTWQSKRGKHRLFRRPEGLPDKAKLEIEAIEVRGASTDKGALSIVPPSVADGFKRHWLPGLSIFDVEPAELPPEIVERLRAPAPQPNTESTSNGAIPEGKRNNELFKLACKLARAGVTDKALEAALMAENEARCKPPLSASEVSGIVRSAEAQGAKGSQTNAEILLAIALADSELWHAPNDVAFATIQRDGHREHWPVRSKTYRQWLAREFYNHVQNAPGSQTMQDVINTLEGKARFDGPARPLFVRVAEHEGRIYLDLADEAWRAVEISSTGWRVIGEPPVRFRRAKGMLPLPVPERGGSVAELRPFVNVAPRHWPLVLGWRPSVPPALTLC
jgi:hypothetical protein